MARCKRASTRPVTTASRRRPLDVDGHPDRELLVAVELDVMHVDATGGDLRWTDDGGAVQHEDLRRAVGNRPPSAPARVAAG